MVIDMAIIILILFIAFMIIPLIIFAFATNRYFNEMERIEKQKIDIMINALEEFGKED
jgi:hypothetical protein|nr:MAG: hypothetical protein [Bacteriophage sp.]UVY07259.1 MAG: hypothetical protein [Bacteriophage sp.]